MDMQVENDLSSVFPVVLHNSYAFNACCIFNSVCYLLDYLE